MQTVATSSLDELKTGWKYLVAAMVGCGLGVSSLPIYTAGVFFPALTAEYGWSRSQLSFAVLLFTLSIGVASPLVGRAIDRFGPVRCAAASIISAVVLYLVLARFVNSLAGFYAVHVLIALLGAAAAPVAYTKVIAGHFSRMKGLAMGITLMGPSLVATVAPAIVATSIDDTNWRAGYIALAVMMAIVLPFLLLLRGQGDGVQAAQAAPEDDNGAFTEAERRNIFRLLITGLALFSLGIGSLIVHLSPMLIDAGLEPVTAAGIVGFLGISGMAGRLIGGWLADRIFAAYILVGVSLSAALGCLALAMVGASVAIPATIAIGFSLGVEADLMGYLVSRYFRRSDYSKVYGWQYAAFIGTVGISPLIMARIFDSLGSYQMGLFLNVVLLTMAAAVFRVLPRYEKPAAVQNSASAG